MLDIRLIRDTPDVVREGLRKVGSDADLDAVIAADDRLRKLKNESQAVAAEQNKISKEIGKAPTPEAREAAKAAGASLKQKLEAMTKQLAEAEADVDAKLLELPNLPHPSVP